MSESAGAFSKAHALSHELTLCMCAGLHVAHAFSQVQFVVGCQTVALHGYDFLRVSLNFSLHVCSARAVPCMVTQLVL